MISIRDRARCTDRTVAQGRVVVVVAVLAALALLTGDRRARALAMLGALVLAPVLLLATSGTRRSCSVVHRHPLLGRGRRRSRWLAVVAACAVVIARRPALLRRAGGGRAAVPGPDPGGRDDVEPAGAALPGRRGGLAGVHRPGAARRGSWRATPESRRRLRPAGAARGSSGCWRCTSCCTGCRRSTRPTSRRRCSRWCSSTSRSRLLYCLLRRLDWTPRADCGPAWRSSSALALVCSRSSGSSSTRPRRSSSTRS